MRRNPFTNDSYAAPLQTPRLGTPQFLPLPETPPHACVECGTQQTPEWRSGPQGKKSLCNACGLRFAKQKRHDSKAQNTSVSQATPCPTQLPHTQTVHLNLAQRQMHKQADFMFLHMTPYVPLAVTTPVLIQTPSAPLQRDPRMAIANLLNPISEPTAESETSEKRKHFTM